MKSDYVWVAAIIAVATAISVWGFDHSLSADFQALWVAGEFYQVGNFNEIYPHETEYFTTKPSPAWIEHVAAQGQKSALYSYIYPPIWAALFAKLTTFSTFLTLSTIAGVINPILLGVMAFLSWRMCSQAGVKVVRAPFYVGLVMLIFMMTTIGAIALFQNQVQIVVSFLIILSLERERAKAPILAGAAMGLAASIKLYPVFFAIFWLAQGKNRAAASFVITGGALGITSILVSGWPLHSIFLHQVGVISNGVFLNSLNYALDALVANLFFQDQLIFSLNAASQLDPDGLFGERGGQLAMAKPPLWSLLSKLNTLIAAFGIAIIAFRTRKTDPLVFWPFALALVSLLSPLAWGYHFLPTVCFAPALIAYMGLRAGSRTLAIIFIPILLGLLPAMKSISSNFDGPQLVGFLCLATYCSVWAYQLFKEIKRAPNNASDTPKNQAIPA